MAKLVKVVIYVALSIVSGIQAMGEGNGDLFIQKLARFVEKMQLAPAPRYCFVTDDAQEVSVSEPIVFCVPMLKKMVKDWKKSGSLSQLPRLNLQRDVFTGVVNILKYSGIKQQRSIPKTVFGLGARLGIDRLRRAAQQKEQRKFLEFLNGWSDWTALVKNRDKRKEFFSAVHYLGLHSLGRAVFETLRTFSLYTLRSEYYKDIRLDLQQYYYNIKALFMDKFAATFVKEILGVKRAAAIEFNVQGDIQLVAIAKNDIINIHHFQTNEKKYEYHHAGVKSVVFGADGTFFISISDDTTRFWSLLPSGKLVGKYADNITEKLNSMNCDSNIAIAMSSDGQWLVVQQAHDNGGYWIRACNLITNHDMEILQEYRKHEVIMALGQNGLLAIGFKGRELDIWDLDTNRCLKRMTWKDVGTEQLKALSFSPDGETLACCFDKTVIMCDVRSFLTQENCLEDLNLQQELLLLAFENHLEKWGELSFKHFFVLNEQENKVFKTLEKDLQNALKTIGMTCT